MVHLLRAGTEFAKTQQTQTMGSYGTNILAYAYSGKYPYGAALKNLTLTYGPGTCSTQLATCQFVNLKGTAENNGKTVYLAQGLFYSGYTYQEGQEYIWHIGVPDEKCSGNGQMPGTWMGTWSDGQYGPKESSSTGAHSVWIR
jgi:membrane-bound inhibitor of C-type lysozyme